MLPALVRTPTTRLPKRARETRACSEEKTSRVGKSVALGWPACKPLDGKKRGIQDAARIAHRETVLARGLRAACEMSHGLRLGVVSWGFAC